MRVVLSHSNRRGQSILEYVVLLAVVTIVVIGAVAALGHRSNSQMANVNTVIQPDGSGATSPGGLPSGGTSGSGGLPTGTGGGTGTSDGGPNPNLPRR